MATPHVDSSKFKMRYGDYRLSPAPVMNYNQESITNDNGERIADRVTLSMAGTLLNLADLGSGDMSAMVAVRDTMIAALSGNASEFQLLHHLGSTSPSGTPVLSGIYPRVENLTFAEGVWVDRIDYAFDLVYETNMVSGQAPVRSFSDGWEFAEDADKQVIRVTHSVSAGGINTAVSGATNSMQNAKTWVLARMGIESVPSGVPGFTQTSGTPIKYERYRTESASEIEGSYAAVSEIVIASGGYARNYTVKFDQDQEGIVVLGIDGEVEGFGRFDDAIALAVSGWNNHIEPALTGLANDEYVSLGGSGTLNVGLPQSFSVIKNPFAGTIGFSVSYTDDPTENLPSGISDLSIAKSVKFPIRLFQTFSIPNRTQGDIVHDIGTPTPGQITINGNVQGTFDTQLAYIKQVAEDEINSLRPNAALYNEIWITQYDTQEDDKRKTFSFGVSWAFTDDLSAAPSASGEVSFS